MTWTNADKVRKNLGLKDTEVPDEDIDYYIDEAQADMLEDIAHYQHEGTLSAWNGSSTTFTTAHAFIADSNFDNSIDTSDITVYGWTDSDDPSTKIELILSTLYSDNGMVVLTTSGSAYELITANYYYYDNKVLTSEFSNACAALAAYYYANGEMAMLPDQWMHGSYRFRIGSGFKGLLEDYHSRLRRITKRMSERGEHDVPTLMRSAI